MHTSSGQRELLLYPSGRKRGLSLALSCGALVLAGGLLNSLAALDPRRFGVLAGLLGFALLAGMVFAGYRSAVALGGLLKPEPTLALTRQGIRAGAEEGDDKDLIRWRDIREARLFTSGGREHLGLVLSSYKMIVIAEDEVNIPLSDLRAHIEAQRRETIKGRRPVASASAASASRITAKAA